MPQADGSIIIDTRINNKGAEADLKALQAKAKSTAQQISALDKEIAKTSQKHLTLYKDLKSTEQQAKSTEKQLESINAQLWEMTKKKADALMHSTPGMSADTAMAQAAGWVERNFPAETSQAAALQAQLDKLTPALENMNRKYEEQQRLATSLGIQRQRLSEQLKKESDAVEKQSELLDSLIVKEREKNALQKSMDAFKSGDDAMQAYFAKQEAAVMQAASKAQARQNKMLGVETDPVKHAEAVVQATQKEIAAQDRAAKAAEERAAREEVAAKRRALANGTTPANVGQNPAGRINTASKAMSRFGSRMREIVSGALLFNIISSGLSALVGWIGSALQSTSAFGQALRNLQGAASVAAAPLIDALGNALAYIINLLATALSYLARFISMLTGKSLSAMKTSAKAMNSYGSAAGNAAKETEKATHSLAGIDEITRLDAPQEETSGGGGSAGPNYDFVDQTGAGFSSLLGMVKSFWDAFKAALSPSIAAWSAAWEQIKATALAVWPQIQAAASGLWTNALQPLLGYLVGTWAPGIINAFSQAFAPIVGGVISTAIQVFADFFVWACGIVTDAINKLLRPALDTVLLIWQGMMDGIAKAWNEYGQPLMDGVIAAFRNVEAIFSTIYYTIIEPIVANLIALVQKLWNEHLKKLWDDVVAMFAAMGTAALDLWNNVLAPVINWLVATFGPIFTDVFNSVAGVVENVIGFISDMIDAAILTFKGFLDFLSAVFRGDWDAAWDAISSTVTVVWERITGTIKNAINGIIGFINGMIQAIVNALNRVGSMLNTLSFTVPDWVPGIGGSTLGFNFGTITAPQIPYLAQGAVIPPNREFMAVLGDQSHGTNVEAPLATIQQAVAAVMQDYQDGNLAALEQVIAVLRQILEAVYGIHIGDAVIGQAVARYNSKQSIITGRA
ncbi:hypothetical protein [uncultured Subdoligranulum sp.]|uniref:hypothetical protein n=1 Tax=uncultured Subdoligranulum sp. TaxID=512298 RepID=UPI0026234259|nr:hypothetical protein [uncultured Subdoligranulum sp.]